MVVPGIYQLPLSPELSDYWLISNFAKDIRTQVIVPGFTDRRNRLFLSGPSEKVADHAGYGNMP
jgi:hypothetical protein